MKRILGLDLGTNSIGWSLIEQNFDQGQGRILAMGSRILPMDAAEMGKFTDGATVSKTADRTRYRGIRRLRERHLLRRERLHRVLHILGFLPEHYQDQIDFTKRLGQFKAGMEPKLVYANGNFIFKSSFLEMLEDFKLKQPKFLLDKNSKECLVPYDWTIYYLRKKALSQKIEKQELAWLLLNFNQKRGYYQLRGEEEQERQDKKEEFHSLCIVDVIADSEKNKKGETWYSLYLENGWIYRRPSKVTLDDWVGKTRDFIVTTEFNEDGSEKKDAEGQVKRSFRAPKEDDWTLIKKKTENEIYLSKQSVGEYIYENLLLDPKQKIKGRLVRTIERKFYRAELEQILQVQSQFHPELQSEELLKKCSLELYKHNIQHRNKLENKDFNFLFIEDIIFYQRPLKSQKSTIANCTLERSTSSSGIAFPIKVISKSHPYFQEFRLLQWLDALEIYTKEEEHKVTTELISNLEDKQSLLAFLNTKKEVKQADVIGFLLQLKNNGKKVPRQEVDKYRWNYVEDKIYPMNETRYLIESSLSKVEGLRKDFLSLETELALWHIIYSVTDPVEYEKALNKFALKHKLDVESFVTAFKNIKPFSSEYGSLSFKAISKLLPLMRFGYCWRFSDIDTKTKNRIEKIISGEHDDTISIRTREKAQMFGLNQEKKFCDLPLWLAKYIVYDFHSESGLQGKWRSIYDIENYLKDFKQHSLRNPVVEQIITETLRVVKDIWQYYGNGVEDFFSEIHIELGRDMKNSAEERKRITQSVTNNENTNLRIKALLAEFKQDSSFENVRPFSPLQQEILKIYEEGALSSLEQIEDDIIKISKTAQPSKSELIRYKLWLEQKYQSPYTGQIIPLNKLFTNQYEIEHIIPQSRYFDDSLSNKVICESAVNKLKDNLLGFEFIKKNSGQIVELGNGKGVRILDEQAYQSFVKKNYERNRGKRSKLLLEDIPEEMIQRQLNNTRYISKYITQLLSNIVRDTSENSKDDGINSIYLLPTNGKITSRLRQDWGLNDVWNDLILPRFIRMNELSNSSDFTSLNSNGKQIPTVPLELSKGFSKKRIDHRHHALDALVVACTTRDHIHLLNNEYAGSVNKRGDLNKKLRLYEKVSYIDQKTGKNIVRDVPKDFKKPWKDFTVETSDVLKGIVVSFKQNLRVINKATNYYQSYKNQEGEYNLDAKGQFKKGFVKQKGINWAIRKPMHAETVSGLVNLPWVKLSKGERTTATRERNDLLSVFKNIKTADAALKKIKKITDTGIQKILKNYILANQDRIELALTAEGLEELNNNIALYNEGKSHQKIFTVRLYEKSKGRFALGEDGVKSKKFVLAAQGTNLFFGIYLDKNQKRIFTTIPLNIVIERLKQGLGPVPEKDEKGNLLLFSLSPNDLVYVPSEEQDSEVLDKTRIYKMVSSTGAECYFIQSNISSVIKSYDAQSKLGELGSMNKLEVTLDGKDRIKTVCIKLSVDRLGNISKA